MPRTTALRLAPRSAFATLALSLAAPLSAQADWNQLTPSSTPPLLTAQTLSSHHAAGNVVLFGGTNQLTNSKSNQTWTWDGTTWALEQPASSPAARAGHGLVEMTAHGVVLLYGGNSSSGLRSDTWQWDGTNWAQLSTNGSPSARSAHMMAYHAGADLIVLHGGQPGNWMPLADTWTFDPTTQTWASVPGPGPGAKLQGSMAYDPVHDVVVLFGGGGLYSPTDETWLFDGTSWTQATPLNRPSPRLQASMGWDAVRERIVLNSGVYGPQNPNRLRDTWEWDGSDWTERTATNGPPLHSARVAMATDVGGEGVVVFGFDYYNTAPLPETWRFATDDVATVTDYGTGCPTSLGVPQLDASGRPWLGDTVQYTLGPVPAGGVPLVFAGYSDTAWNGRPLPVSLAPLGFPGCELLQSADANFSGDQLSVVIPNVTALAGQSLFFQGAILEATPQPTLGVSAGSALTLGIR